MTSVTQPDEGEEPGPSPPPRRRMAAADRRALILDAALEVFAAQGFHEASLEMVAERAGISKALIYEHFPSKRALHSDLLESFGRELMGRVIDAIENAQPGGERLLRGADAFLEFVEQHPGAWKMVFRNSGDPDVTEWLEGIRGQAATAITTLMARDAPAEVTADADEFALAAEMLAQQLLGSIQNLANWWEEHPDIPRERILAVLMDFAWLGMDRVRRGERWAEPEAGVTGTRPG